LRIALQRLTSCEQVSLFSDHTNLIFEKFHPYLARDLLELDALSAKVDVRALGALCKRIVNLNFSSPDATGGKRDHFSD
jgi:ATP-dependent helicase Lhr and Lhr-like helicase